MIRQLASLSVLLAAILLTGCASTQGHEKSDSADASDEATPAEELEDKTIERDKLTRDLAVAKEKLEQLKLTTANQEADDRDAMEKANKTLAIAEAKFSTLKNVDAPLRLDDSRVDMLGYTNRLVVEQEELAQLLEMYKDNDLADKTREIVINRKKRELEIYEKALAIHKRQAEMLEKQTIPNELRDSEKAPEEAKRDVDEQKRKTQANVFEKKIEKLTAESEITHLEAEIKQANRKMEKLEKKKAEADKEKKEDKK